MRIPWLTAVALIAMLVGAAVLYVEWNRRVPPVFAAAAEDHRHEVVDRYLQPWILNPFQLKLLTGAQTLPESVLTALLPSGYLLQKGKLCRLNRDTFLHLVFLKDKQEYSVYLRSGTDRMGPGFSLTSVKGRRLYQHSLDDDRVAYFDTGKWRALFVASSPGDPMELARIAAGTL